MVSVVSPDTFKQLQDGKGTYSSSDSNFRAEKSTTQAHGGSYQYNQQTDKPATYYFKGKEEVLSNFFKTRLKIFNRQFGTSEGAYQYCKAVFHDYLEVAEDLVYAHSGLAAKAISHKVPTDPKWHELKAEAMRVIIGAKIEQCLPFRKFLLDHPETKLIEDTENDYWARGPDHRGENMLGKILMEIRDEWKDNQDATEIRTKRMEEFMSKMKWPEPRASTERKGYNDRKWNGERGERSFKGGRRDERDWKESRERGDADQAQGNWRKTDSDGRPNQRDRRPDQRDRRPDQRDRRPDQRDTGYRQQSKDQWNIKKTEDPGQTPQLNGKAEDFDQTENKDPLTDIDYWNSASATTPQTTDEKTNHKYEKPSNYSGSESQKSAKVEDKGAWGDSDTESQPEKTNYIPGASQESQSTKDSQKALKNAKKNKMKKEKRKKKKRAERESAGQGI